MILPPFALLRTWLYVAVVVCYIVAKLGHLPEMGSLLSALSLLAVLGSLPASGWVTRLLATLFLVSGSWMLFQHGASWLDYFGAFGEMAYLLALFVVLPVCSVPVKLGGYSQAIQTVLLGRIGGAFQLNCLVTTLAYICGSFMSLAAVPIMMASMEPVVRAYPIQHKERFIAVSTAYGYALPILWTPVSGVVGVVLYTLHVEWLMLFPVLFALSIVCLLANWLIYYFIEADGGTVAAEVANLRESDAASPLPRLLEMVLAIVLLIVGLALLEYWLHLGLITAVTLLVIPFALAWSLVIGRGQAFYAEAGMQMATRLPRMADQFLIFLSAGFFARAMHLSGFDHTANLLFLHWHEDLGTIPFLLLMPPMALLASFLGMHPLVMMALLGESLKPEVLGINSTQLAVTMIGSAVLTYMAGPFSGTLGLVQSINHVSTFRLSLWNAPYALGYLLLLAVTIVLL